MANQAIAEFTTRDIIQLAREHRKALVRRFLRMWSSRRLVIDEIPEEGFSFEEYERRIIVHALRRNHWNRSRTARELVISRPRLLRKIEKFGLVAPPEGDGRL